MLYVYFQFQNTEVDLVWKGKKKRSIKFWRYSSVCVHLVCHGLEKVEFASVHLCTKRRWGKWLVGGNKWRAFSPDASLSVRLNCFVLWSIKIWGVYSSRRPIHSREHSLPNGLIRSKKRQRSHRRSPTPAPKRCRDFFRFNVASSSQNWAFNGKNHSKDLRSPTLRGVSRLLLISQSRQMQWRGGG